MIDKKMLIITACGSDFSSGSALASFDFQETFLRTMFNFIGIIEIQFIHAKGLRSDRREDSLAEARDAIQTLASSW
ncbi:NAD(P)H-dependent oxidoreductase [Phormidium sp. FACHB-592]|nr:NAD(P)H-dependent oxidoreductase [Phormidium sp. FACHB-592]